MTDKPQFSILEFILSGLFVGAALSSLIFTIKLVADAQLYDAMESGGLTIMLCTAVADPVHFGLDFMTFPLKLWQRSGHETFVTMTAAYVGLALFATGWLFNYANSNI
jgi:hypothetical protein